MLNVILGSLQKLSWWKNVYVLHCYQHSQRVFKTDVLYIYMCCIHIIWPQYSDSLSEIIVIIKKNAALHNLNFKLTQQLLLKVLKQTINCEDFLHSITNKSSIKQPCTWYLHNCSVNLLVKLWLISVKCHGSCLFARLVLACGRTNTACCQL